MEIKALGSNKFYLSLDKPFGINHSVFHFLRVKADILNQPYKST